MGESSRFSYNLASIALHTPETVSAPTDKAVGGLPLPSGIQARFERSLHTDFSQVRLFPNRADVTGPLQARAVTFDQNIYFHPDQFRPGTFGGDMLLAHELAHVMQMRVARDSLAERGSAYSQPGDSLEHNADAIARGDTVSVLPAHHHMALRLPLDTETEPERLRRERLVRSISHAISNILRLLQTGGLVQGSEVAEERNGVRGVTYSQNSANSIFESYPERQARLQNLVRSLMGMGRQYRSAVLPAEFSPPVPLPAASGGGYQSAPFEYTVDGRAHNSSATGGTAAWADLQGAYTRYRVAHGQRGFDMVNWLFLDPNLHVIPGALRGVQRMRQGIQTGINIVVPDIERYPLRYSRLSGFEQIPRGSVIVELWHDNFGYYYMYHDQRIDVPYNE